MKERFNKQDEEMKAQRKDWERRFNEQQEELEKQKKQSELYRNLYEATKIQLDHANSRYSDLLKQTQTKECNVSTKNSNNVALPQQPKDQAPHQRRSRSRSRGPKHNSHSRDLSTRRLRPRGSPAKRSRSRGRTVHQSPIQSYSSDTNNGENPPLTKMKKHGSSKQRSGDDLEIPINLFELSDDDSMGKN